MHLKWKARTCGSEAPPPFERPLSETSRVLQCRSPLRRSARQRRRGPSGGEEREHGPHRRSRARDPGGKARLPRVSSSSAPDARSSPPGWGAPSLPECRGPAPRMLPEGGSPGRGRARAAPKGGRTVGRLAGQCERRPGRDRRSEPPIPRDTRRWGPWLAASQTCCFEHSSRAGRRQRTGPPIRGVWWEHRSGRMASCALLRCACLDWPLRLAASGQGPQHPPRPLPLLSVSINGDGSSGGLDNTGRCVAFDSLVGAERWS